MPDRNEPHGTRRAFLARAAAGLAAAGAMGIPRAGAEGAGSVRAPGDGARVPREGVVGSSEDSGTSGNPKLTVQQVIDRILSEVPPLPADTVDTVKAGDPSQVVTGIVTTFLDSCEVIDRAIALGANLVITHEPTFYNHRDNVDWLDGDPVYRHKRELLNSHGIVVWRFHDGIHRLQPDAVVEGVLEDLGWKDRARADNLRICDIPPASLGELAALFKERLGATRVLAAGDREGRYRTIGLMVGAAGGERQMRFARETGVELLVVGELAEWETSEYMRDAAHAGLHRAVLSIGHAASEEPGMKWLAGWMRPRFPGLTITHVPLRDALLRL